LICCGREGGAERAVVLVLALGDLQQNEAHRSDPSNRARAHARRIELRLPIIPVSGRDYSRKEAFMDSRTILRTLLPCTLAAALAGASAIAVADDNDNDKHHTTHATFGRGLNTAQQGNVVNHVVLPSEIKVKAGGVVDFGVAGFHDIIVFKPGFTLDDLVAAGGGQYPNTPPAFVLPADPAAPLPPELAFLGEKIHYRGLNPAGGPLATPVSGNPANGSNRREPVAFLDQGTYLVICNVRGHLLDGMYAYVKVN
jgi:uncharacterized cupredoxin-like copper-binding protein